MGKIWLIPVAFVLIFLSPLILWNSASQNRAGDFKSAKEVESNSSESGYILVEGEAKADEGIECPKDSEKSCIYVSEKIEEYVREEKEICSSTKPEEKIIENTSPKCDESDNCTPCYLVEEYTWDTKNTDVKQTEFKIGNYEISAIDKANKIGLKEYEKIVEPETSISEENTGLDELLDYYYGEEENDPYYEVFNNDEDSETEEATEDLPYTPREGDLRFTYSYFESGEDYVVAGEARNNEIYKGDKEFVVSAKSYGETLSTLGSQDSSASVMLKIISFLLITCGFGMLLTSIASIPLLLTKVIPFIGDDIKKLANSVLTFAGFALGAVIWAAMYIVISILKSPILLALIFAGVGFFAYRVWSKKNQVVEVKVEPKETL